MMQYCIVRYDAQVAEPLSTTSFAVLGMLALRPWTPYDLTQQIKRSLAYCWPTSERAIYNEPERLVAAGLASVATAASGMRIRRTYSITPAGRERLRAWLSTEPEAPRWHDEALLHLLFADHAGKADLLRALARLRDHIAVRHLEGIQQIAPYLEGDGPFPERAHLVAIFADLYRRLFNAYEEWADEAIAEVATWDTTVGRGLTEHARRLIGRSVASGPAPPSEVEL
jgi:DNA-binding PadR family transcriptional regulator